MSDYILSLVYYASNGWSKWLDLMLLPLTVVRRRMAIRNESIVATRPFDSIWDCVYGIVKHEGFESLFRGFTLEFYSTLLVAILEELQ
jgi:hypothetical protein